MSRKVTELDALRAINVALEEVVAAANLAVRELASTSSATEARLARATKVVNEQAEDESLWFQPVHITEDILQKALRRLHAAVEGVTPDEAARAFLRDAKPEGERDG